MKNIIKLSLFLFAVFLGSISFAQEMIVTGTVHDSTGVKPIKNAMVMGVRMKDSLLLGFTRSDADGNFELRGFEMDTFSLIIDHPYLDDKTYYIFGHKENYEINIPSVRMQSKSQEIAEVVIYANTDPIFYRGDTLVYLADSFQVQEGAVVEDLLKKLPGIQVDKDGKITMGGEEISQVLVDGDEFFGTDPTVATKNLGADGVEQVQVYEKENDDGIGGDDEKIQVLDLKLKDNAKKGYFGRISGASDFALTSALDGNKYDIGNSFFEGELLLNKFKGSQKISVFALTTNTPRSNFALGDMSKFGLQNEDGSNGQWWNDNTRNTSGVPQTLKAGIYFSDKIGKKKGTKIGFNYSYYNTKLDASSASRSQYFLTDTTYISDDSTRNLTASHSHRLNFNLESKLDSLTTLTVKPSFRYDIADASSSEINDYFDLNNAQTIGTSINSTDKSKGYQLNGKVAINRKFMKKKRELEVRYDIALNDNKTEGTFNSLTRYFSTFLLDTLTDQERTNNNSNNSHYGTITYIEPLWKDFELELEYLYEYGFSTQDKKSFDDNNGNGVYDSLRTDLSNVFDNIRQQHRGGVSLIYELKKKHTFAIGTRVRNIDILNNNQITGIDIHQNITNILPRARYKFQAGRGKRFSIDYRTSSQQPSINDLQPVVDITNPNRISEGNPNLKPNYKHTIDVTLRNFDPLSNKFIWAGASFSITNNAFSDSTTYDSFGRTYSKTVNVDGNMLGYAYGGIYLPFLNRKISIRPQLVTSYFKNSNFISSQKNVTTNIAVTPELDVDFSLLGDSLQFGVFGKYSYNYAISSLNNQATPSSVQEYGANFEWRLPLGFKFGFEGTYTNNSQSGVGYDTEYFVFNAEVSKRFLKTQNLEIGIMGNDIFNENINARREVNGNILTDYRTTIISRYFLLKATYRFNNRKTREDDFKGMH